MHWQVALLANGGPTVVGQISNDVVTQTGAPQSALAAPAALVAGRAFAAGFFDRDNNNGAGDLVVAGGGGGTLTSASGARAITGLTFARSFSREVSPLPRSTNPIIK